jgi:hypothetical protein
LSSERHEVAKLSEFDIRIQPLANLVRSDQHCVYGIVAPATHNELRRVYDNAQTTLGGPTCLSLFSSKRSTVSGWRRSATSLR